MMPRILFISKGTGSASTRYRALDYFPALQTAGWQCEHISTRGGLWQRWLLLRAARKADVVVVLRKTFPAWYTRLLRKAAKRLVFDFDDAVFARSNGGASPKRARQFAHMVSLSDAVWAGNAFLAEQAAQHNQGVQIVPTAIAMQRYTGETEKHHAHTDLVWIGSSSTRRYLETVLPVLHRAYRDIPALRLKIIADFDLPHAGIPTLAVRWSADSEVRELASAHIGIAPMPDNTWTRGKCALKVLQYMAAGLPVISANAGANAEVIEHGVSGLLCNNDDEWLAAITQLANDPQRRAAMGEAGQQRCAERYSQDAVFQKIRESLERL
ncbi:MAG: glycosyltransferase family 4 protein [Granulosicoccaceae bacterium]|jgi:glycosyltransferase involved in cell wall biosynthesis